jgi:hypothetical protein
MKILKKGNSFVAYRTEKGEHGASFAEAGSEIGRISITTGKYLGGTGALVELNKRLDEYLMQKKQNNYIGNYGSIHDFIGHHKLEDKASDLFGEDWEAENDIEQIQELVGNEYTVQEIEPTTEREKRMDDYIQVTKK